MSTGRKLDCGRAAPGSCAKSVLDYNIPVILELEQGCGQTIPKSSAMGAGPFVDEPLWLEAGTPTQAG